MDSWFCGFCVKCDFPVVVTQPGKGFLADYRWYCSNPDCKCHSYKEHSYDDEQPEWVKDKQ